MLDQMGRAHQAKRLAVDCHGPVLSQNADQRWKGREDAVHVEEAQPSLAGGGEELGLIAAILEVSLLVRFVLESPCRNRPSRGFLGLISHLDQGCEDLSESLQISDGGRLARLLTGCRPPIC